MDSAVIKHVAGGGKTTYSRNLLKNNPRGLYLTYNNAVRDEILGEGHLALTIDSFFTGFVIPKALSKVPLIPDGVKVLLNEEGGYRSGSRRIEIHQDGSLFNGSNIINEVSLNTQYEHFVNMTNFSNKMFLNIIFGENTLKISHQQRDELVQFIVSNYGDYILDTMSRRFSYVIIDEAQDIKASKESFVELLRTSSIPTIILGDENQNINNGSDWFSGLIPTERKEKSYRCGDGICEWIRDNLQINVSGTDNEVSYIKISYDNVQKLDDGLRVLLYKANNGVQIKNILQLWSGPKRTIQNSKGSTIDQDIVIIGGSLTKRFMYTALTRTTKNAYSTVSKINS